MNKYTRAVFFLVITSAAMSCPVVLAFDRTHRLMETSTASLSSAQISLEQLFMNAEASFQNKDWQLTRSWCQMVINDSRSSLIQAMDARSKLVQLYYLGGNGIQIDYKQAMYHARQIVDRQDFVSSSRYLPVLLYMGQMLVKGGNGIEKDFIQARMYLQAVSVNERAVPWDRASACLGLGIIYYRGEYGIAQDYTIAHDYFNQVIENDSASDEDRVWARKFMRRMR